MADHEKERQMDKMLDSLLASYSSAEPRPGMETRILANLRDAAGREVPLQWWNFKWLWAATVTAIIIVAAILIAGRQYVVPPSNVVIRNTRPVSPRPEIQTGVPATHETAAKLQRQKPSAPGLLKNTTLALDRRPAVFPTPTPLSEQERLLLRYLAGTPREEVIAQSHPEEPPAGDQDQTQAMPDLTHIPQKASNTR